MTLATAPATAAPKILPDRRITLLKQPKLLGPADAPAIVVLGLDAGGKAHAARFAKTDVELATKAAGLMGFATLSVDTVDVRDLAVGLPAGRVFASGRAFCPFVRRSAFDALMACEGVRQPAAAAPTAPPVRPAAGKDAESDGQSDEVAEHRGDRDVNDDGSDLLAVGAVVLAREEAEPGWFEATITEDVGESLLTLTWRDWPELPSFVRRREHVVPLPAALRGA